MYFEKDGNEFVIFNESGHEVATRYNEKDANRFIKEYKKSRKTKNDRREARISYSSRSDD
jgi:hypothetical protein